MAMLGKVGDLTEIVNPRSRLQRGLWLLQDLLAGRILGIASELPNLGPGETRRVAVDGDDFYFLIQCYKTKQRDDVRFEAHARHTDLQYVWSGGECIEFCDLHTSLPAVAYDKNGNVYFPVGKQSNSRLLVHAGEVAVLLPDDAHAACLSLGGGGQELVRKIVVKIRDAHLLEAPESGYCRDVGNPPGSVRVTAAFVTGASNPNRGAAL
jgi:YhcH/YjgK/YiaL family protein